MQNARRIVVALSVLAIIACAWFAPLDAAALQQVDAGLKRALVTFATARTLNAVISVAQGTEVSAQPLGVGVNFTPGQLLDPVNDLVEQFADLMLAASVAFGMQRALIAIGASWLVSLALSTAVLGWAWLYFRRQPAPAWLSRLLVILLMLRFAVPVVTIGGDLLFQKFLAADYEASQRIIDTASGQTAGASPAMPIVSGDQGLLDKMKGWWSQNADVKARFEDLQRAAEQATEHIIKLIVVFLLQTLVIPLLLFWALYAAARSAFESPRQTGAPSQRSR